MKISNKRIWILITTVLALLCLCVGVLSFSDNTVLAEESTVDSGYGVILSVTTVGSGSSDKEEDLRIRIMPNGSFLTNSTYKETLQTYTHGNSYNDYFHSRSYVLVMRSTSPDDYYKTLSKTNYLHYGDYNLSVDDSVKKACSPIYSDNTEIRSFLLDSTECSSCSCTSILNGYTGFSGSASVVSNIYSCYTDFSKIENVNYYYWSCLVKVSYFRGAYGLSFNHDDFTDTECYEFLDVLGSYGGSDSNYGSIYKIEEIAKSGPVTYDGGQTGPLMRNGYDSLRAVLNNESNYFSSVSQSIKNIVVACQKKLGYYHESNATISVKYKVFENGVLKDTTIDSIPKELLLDESQDSVPLSIDPYYITSKKQVWNTVNKLLSKKSIADYNAIKENQLSLYSEGDDYVATTDSRIVLQAKDYEYTYGTDNTGTITIIYNDFQYKDLYLRIYNNDDTNEYFIDYYPIDVSIDKDIVTLTYYEEDIIKRVKDVLGLLVDFDTNKVVIPELDKFSFVTKTDLKKEVNGNQVDAGFSLSFNINRQADLLGMDLKWCAIITEDKDYDFSFEYQIYNGNLGLETKTISYGTKKYSDLAGYGSDEFLAEFKESYPLESMKLDNGTVIAKYNGIKKGKDTENCRYVIKVQYTFYPIIKVTSSFNGDVLDKYSLYVFGQVNSLNRYASEFGFIVPDGYRIKGFTCSDNAFRIGTFNKRNPYDTVIQLDKNLTSDEFTVYEINAVLTDTWPVSIDYLKQVKNDYTGAGSCFAELKNFTGEVKVGNFDMYALTPTDVAGMIKEGTGDNVQSLSFNKINVRMSKIKCELGDSPNGDCYYITIEYSNTYIKGISSDGSYNYYNVPLSCFKDWQEFVDTDINIMALAPDVFKYSDSIAPEKLYGFFNVLTFKEQFSDFDSWFKEFTASDGCVTFFKSKEVRGSEFYKFLTSSSSLGAILGGTVGLIFCAPITGAAIGTGVQTSLITISESLNDENGTYYSYFFYLDGTNNKSYASHNGAINYDDEESSSEKWLESLLEDFTPILRIVLIVLLVCILAPLLPYVVKAIVYIVSLPIKFFKWLAKKTKGGR